MRLALACGVWMLGAASAFANALPVVGEAVADRLELLDKTVPLPPGAWRVAATGSGTMAGETAGPGATIGGVLLVRPPEAEQAEFLLIHTNAGPLRTAWGAPEECSSQQSVVRAADEAREGHTACSFVIPLRRAALLRTGLPGFGTSDVAARLDTLLPSWALVAGLRVADRRDVLDIRYGTAPRHPDPSGWFAPEPDAAHRRVAAQFGRWAEAARGTALASLRAPPAQVPALPVVDAELPAARATPQAALPLRLLAERIPSTMMGFTVMAFAIGDPYVAGAVLFWQSLTQSAVYFGNELAWAQGAEPPKPLIASPQGLPTHASLPDHAPVQVASSVATLPFAALPVQNVYSLEGKQVPLPAGAWHVLASEAQAGTSARVLGQIDDGAIHGLLLLRTNAAPTTGIVAASDECGRDDIWFAVSRYDTAEDGFCAYGKRVVPISDPAAARADRLWSRALARLSEQGVSLPPTLGMVGARVRTPANFIDARYYFPADGFGEPQGALQRWVDQLQEPLELGVRGRYAPRVATPWPGDSAAPAHEADASWDRSFFKDASYRVGAYLGAFGVQTLFTGNPMQSAALAGVQITVKPLIAALGDTSAPATPLNFPEIGSDR